MKLIEPTHKTEKKNDFLKLSDQIRQIIPFGKKEDPAEDAILARFLKGMDNRFFLLYNLQLENIGPPFPPIVAGPTGVYVLNISSEKGFFKGKGQFLVEDGQDHPSI